MRRGIAVGLGAALALTGCGKADISTSASASAPAPAPARTATAAKAPAPRTSTVPVPLHLTAARAAAFAKAVELTGADVPGSHPARRRKPPLAREREAAGCGGRTAPAVGSGRSPELQRGRGLERESLSSGVEVLRDAGSVEGDLAYAQTRAGLRCYERVLSHSLREETDPHIKLLGVRVAPLAVSVAGAGAAKGIRILARVGVPGAGVVVRLFVDALSLPYGPAEIDLYGTSFVQPVPQRTEQELLALLHERARHHPL
jgi:hypothetical protein